MTVLPVVTDWFARASFDDGVTLLTEPNVHPLLRCNIWHLAGRDRDVVIDSGLGVASLTKCAADLFDSSVMAVATHAHMDHVGGLHEFSNTAIHNAEAEALAHADGNLPLDVADYDSESLHALAEMGYDIQGGLLTAVPHAAFSMAKHELIGATATTLLSEGDVIELGDRTLEVLHLPGHSPGSIGLLDRKRRVLFSGDAIYDGPLLDTIPGSDIATYVETMHRLRALPVDTIHAGHDTSMSRRRMHEVIDEYLAAKGA